MLNAHSTSMILAACSSETTTNYVDINWCEAVVVIAEEPSIYS